MLFSADTTLMTDIKNLIMELTRAEIMQSV
jgi:hypothetical protein